MQPRELGPPIKTHNTIHKSGICIFKKVQQKKKLLKNIQIASATLKWLALMSLWCFIPTVSHYSMKWHHSVHAAAETAREKSFVIFLSLRNLE